MAVLKPGRQAIKESTINDGKEKETKTSTTYSNCVWTRGEN